MRAKICFILLLIVVIASISGCIANEKSTKKLAERVAKFQSIDFKTVERYENFKEIADNINDLIQLLNREGGFDIQELKGTQEEYEKIGKVLTKYTTLIDNYNKVVQSAKEYDNYGTSEKKDAFYIAVSEFGLETALIVTAAYAVPVYDGLGIAYRASGLNIIAPSCPTCVSIILSNAHWLIRTYMVEKSAEAAGKAEQILKQIESLDEIKAVIQESQYFANNTINRAYNFSSSWDKISLI